jgi:hypothetical protein
MVKVRFWSKVEIEVDTETGQIRILKGFHQPSAGLALPKEKPKKPQKVEATATSQEVLF